MAENEQLESRGMGAACFSRRAPADPESECQEGPSKSQEKKYVEHRGSPLEQTNLPSLERQKRKHAYSTCI